MDGPFAQSIFHFLHLQNSFRNSRGLKKCNALLSQCHAYYLSSIGHLRWARWPWQQLEVRGGAERTLEMVHVLYLNQYMSCFFICLELKSLRALELEKLGAWELWILWALELQGICAWELRRKRFLELERI